MTVIVFTVWLIAQWDMGAPVPWIGAAMWVGGLLAILALSAQRFNLLWYVKAGIAIYALAVIGSRIYLNYTAHLTPEQWAAQIGSSENAASVKVLLARQSMLHETVTARHWNLLGIAQYRTGDPTAAIESLHKSMELASGGDAEQWLFLAMCLWQKEDRQKAREWYDKAAVWIEKTDPADEEYDRFRVEAASLLGVNTTIPARDDDPKHKESPP